jgi:hypothetical protein
VFPIIVTSLNSTDMAPSDRFVAVGEEEISFNGIISNILFERKKRYNKHVILIRLGICYTVITLVGV